MQTKNSINQKKVAEIGQRCKGEIIYKGDPRIESYRRDAVMAGDPDAVVRPRDWQEVAEILDHCNANKIPLTVCGSRTSMTGASVAEEGILLTTENFNQIIDIGVKNGRPYAITEPGVIARNFQRAVEEHKFSYPTVPTSCDEALIGATVATNATGEDFYKYGPTRNYVREITFLKPNGTTHTLTRATTPNPSKGLGGYYLNGDEIDLLIGSEGTLGIFTRIACDLLPNVPETFIILIPFPSNMAALEFIDSVNRSQKQPRCLEYIDTSALSIMQQLKECPKFSSRTKALVYLKEEAEEGERDGILEEWLGRLNTPLADEAIVAITDRQKEDLHKLRHHIPSHIAEVHQELEKTGGGKVSGDWWVPREKMPSTMRKVYEESESLKIEFTAYGHLGDGHPHIGFICKTANEKKKAKELIEMQCRRAVSLGGGVAAEHGIGKIKRDLLSIQYGADTIAKMRAIKQKFDPNWILGRGNILA